MQIEDLEEIDLSPENKSNDGNTSPTMVFSVIGDSDSFVPRPWPTTVFQTALIEAAKSGGETWILYSGLEKGLSKIVRDAYQNYEDMEIETDIINNQRHVKLINLAESKTTQDNEKGQRRGLKIMKEKQYKGKEPTKDSSLLAFERFISTQKVSFYSQQMDISMPVPIAIIVCEGDLNTISEITEALEHKLPVIIMKGSGKAADLVLDYIDRPEDLRMNASSLLGIRFNETDYGNLKKELSNISEKANLIRRFDLDRDDPLILSNIIGQAVVSCWSMNENNDHNMTGSTISTRFSFNKEDKLTNQSLEGYEKDFRPYVLNPKYSCPTSLPLYFYFGYQLLQEKKQMKDCGPVLLLEALKANRCDYVRVLLDRGVQLYEANLLDLYQKTVACQGCEDTEENKACLHMQWILKQIHETHADTVFGKKGNSQKTTEDKCSVAEAAKKLCCKILRYKRYRGKNKVGTSKNNDGISTYADVSDLLLWSVFANRRELAEICWLRGKDHLLTGLVCSAILKKLSKKAGNVKEQVLSNDLENHSKLFEQRCISMMDRMYEENTEQAIDLMDTEAEDIWGIHSSPLTFAYENFMYDVVAHTCSQKNMNKKWYNELPPDPFLASAITHPKKFVTAPLTKYVFNYMLFFTMLFMYSAFVLTSISTKYYVQDIARVFEYYVYFWGAGDFIEELISCFGCLEARGRSHRSYYYRMKRYLYDFWNVVDLLSYALLIAALFVRHFYIDESFTIARRMFALSLLVMYLRFLEVFLIHRKLGPTLIMIKEMLKDLLRFLFIAVFVVLGVGIYYHANLWPDHQTIWSGDWTNWRIWTIIYYPYWQLYAELNLEHLDGSDQSDETNCTNVDTIWESDTSINRCPQEDWTVQAVAAIYLLFSNLLLVNLVIAMFSYTFERVQVNSEKLWRFERYTVINDYEWRIPSPINLVFLPYRFMCCPGKENCCLHKCKGECNKDQAKKDKQKKTKNQEFQIKFQRISALKNHNKI